MTASWLPTAALVLILDQASKSFALSWPDKKGQGSPAWSGPRIRPVKNVKIGLGLVREPCVLAFIWGVALLGTGLLIHWFAPLQRQSALVGFGVALGGATGNLIDVLRYGSVIDFIDLRIWPVFNLADVAILTGVVAVVWSVLAVG